MMSLLRDNVNLGPAELRRLVKSSCVSAPGVFDGISAILAEHSGFKALYVSGSGLAGRDGLPDLSLTTLSEVASGVASISSVTKLPLIVDVDTGFGEALNVIRTVRVMERSGAAAVHIEDQRLPKKCGHLPGKELVPEDEMCRKISAAVSARKDDDFMVIARTDARAVEGMDSAVERAKSYIESGADCIFPEALESEEEFRAFRKRVRAPLLANMTEFGVSPLLSVDELARIGYSIVIFPLTAFRVSARAIKESYEVLARDGTQRSLKGRMMSRDEFYDVIGYRKYEEEDGELGSLGRKRAKRKG